jgi:hypothetical protein
MQTPHGLFYPYLQNGTTGVLAACYAPFQLGNSLDLLSANRMQSQQFQEAFVSHRATVARICVGRKMDWYGHTVNAFLQNFTCETDQ